MIRSNCPSGISAFFISKRRSTADCNVAGVLGNNATGQLAGQNGWFNATNAYVQTSNVESGSQAVSVNAGTSQVVTYQPMSYNSVANPYQLITISTDFMLTLGLNVTWEALTAFGDGGFINQIVVNGTTGQVCGANPCGGPILTPGTWYNLSMQLDYSTHTMTDFVNGVAFSSAPFDDVPALSNTLSAIGIGINNGSSGGTSTASWDNISVVSSAVPEPASWTIMLAGFAFLGFAGTGWRKAANKSFAA
jgi:hypothetical protein